jgi:transcriptional regulator with XRE-family HTH domain
MKNLRKIRRALDMTQAELARRLGVTKEAVCRWEKGKGNPPLARVMQIAKVLNCTVNDLIGEKEAG